MNIIFDKLNIADKQVYIKEYVTVEKFTPSFKVKVGQLWETWRVVWGEVSQPALGGLSRLTPPQYFVANLSHESWIH